MSCAANCSKLFIAAIVFVGGLSQATRCATAAQLYVGAATISITPDEPIALQGQMHVRISTQVETPCIATALAIESRDGDKVIDQAVFVACDLTFVPLKYRNEVRRRVKEQVAGFDADKLVLSATHTHTGPVMEDGVYVLPTTGIMQPAQYFEFASGRLADVIRQAWQSRAAASASWGLGHAVVARNRLAIYGDGHAQMYGGTDRPDFVRLEGYEDHGVEVLFFWNCDDQLIATALNVACPAQEVEGHNAVNADFWHPVREKLRATHGKDLMVLGWTGPGGDQSPHAMFRKAAEQRMQRLRKLSSMDDIANRIVAAWEEAYAGAREEKHADPIVAHRTQTIELPKRQVSREEMLAAKVKIDALANKPGEETKKSWNQTVVDRFEQQKPGDTYPMELHVVRLGDVAIASNDFELYTDYGIQMKARSPALQTFLLQLSGPGTYLPAERSLAGGAYGSVIQSGSVGPEGGRVLVEKTLESTGELFPASAAK
jgi:hypothetical protein